MYTRVRNIILVLSALCFSLFRESAKKSRNANNFLIVYPGNNIGDMVCVTPLFSAIRKQYPTAKITVAGTPINQALLEHHPLVDEYILWNQSIWSLIKVVRVGKFDAGVSINMDALTIAVLFLGRVGTISSFILSENEIHTLSRSYRTIARLVHTIPYTSGVYIPRKSLELLIPFRISETVAIKSLVYSKDVGEYVAQMCATYGFSDKKKILAIAPSAGADYKRWPAERFAMVANQMHLSYGMFCIVIGGQNDTRAITEFLSHVSPSTPVFNPGVLTMDALKAFLAYSSLLIGNDSGAVHVAEAVGTKTITVAGATDVREHMEEDESHKIVTSADTYSLSNDVYRAYVGNESFINSDVARKKMEAVSVDMVMRIVKELIE